MSERKWAEIDPGPMPHWYADSSFHGNNPDAQRAQAARWWLPKSTPAERAEAQRFIAEPAYACAKCDKYSFEKPKLCYWCRRGIAT